MSKIRPRQGKLQCRSLRFLSKNHKKHIKMKKRSKIRPWQGKLQCRSFCFLSKNHKQAIKMKKKVKNSPPAGQTAVPKLMIFSTKPYSHIALQPYSHITIINQNFGAEILKFQCFGLNSTHKAPPELIPELATTTDHFLCAGSVKTRFKALN